VRATSNSRNNRRAELNLEHGIRDRRIHSASGFRQFRFPFFEFYRM